MRHRPAFIEAFPSALYPRARWLAAHPLPEFGGDLAVLSERAHGGLPGYPACERIEGRLQGAAGSPARIPSGRLREAA